MDTSRIAELLGPFLRAPIASEGQNQFAPSSITKDGCLLSATQLEYISTYVDILIRWNSRINLTAIGNPEDIVTRHFGESLFAARHLFPQLSSAPPVSPVLKGPDSPCTAADVGTGAGFPGLPMKIWKPDLSLTLIESNQRKATFLREIIRALTLTDVNVQTARAETLKTTFDVVTLRAVEQFERILPTAASLVAPTGRLALMIGSGQNLRAQFLLPTLSWSIPRPIPNTTSRILLTASRQWPQSGTKRISL